MKRYFSFAALGPKSLGTPPPLEVAIRGVQSAHVRLLDGQKAGYVAVTPYRCSLHLRRTLSKLRYSSISSADVAPPPLFCHSRLATYLPLRVDETKAVAKWDAGSETLAVTLPIVGDRW